MGKDIEVRVVLGKVKGGKEVDGEIVGGCRWSEDCAILLMDLFGFVWSSFTLVIFFFFFVGWIFKRGNLMLCLV